MSKRVAASLVTVLLVSVAYAAYRQGGLFGLPYVPSGVTLESAGLADLDAWSRTAGFLAGTAADLPEAEVQPCVRDARQGLLDVRAGQVEPGVAKLRSGVEQCPDDPVLGNIFRMTLFQLKRESLRAAREAGDYNAQLPDHLRGEPLATLSRIVREHPSRGAKLQLALAWVDQMLLFPALEVKAPSSVEAVKIFTEILNEYPHDVPALFGRGLNHLHRPSRLVWPETAGVSVDAAANDIGAAVAIGQKVGAGSERVQGVLSLALGDAYVKAGRLDVARSWWQVAQNLDRSETMASAVRRRFSWRNETVLDDLEAELDRGRAELDEPLSDLSFLWD